MEEVKHIITVTDNRKIKNIVFKYPDLLASNAEEIIKNEYLSLLELKDRLRDTRSLVLELEKEVAEKEKKFRDITHNCTIEFETSQKECVTKKTSILIKGQGNDILGFFNN
jgi:phosphomevalonate kinase